MTDFSQTDIVVPIIEITTGWTVDDILTEDDCDDAFAVLTAAICSIEAQIDDATEQGRNSGDHFRRLKGALRWKKAALSVVNIKRGKLTRSARQASQDALDRRVIERFSALFPAEYRAALIAVQGMSEHQEKAHD